MVDMVPLSEPATFWGTSNASAFTYFSRTVGSLASEVAMSGSSFANRFTETLGEPGPCAQFAVRRLAEINDGDFALA
jgi:hypothetical protein